MLCMKQLLIGEIMDDSNFPCNICEKIEYCGNGDTCISLEKYYSKEGELIHMALTKKQDKQLNGEIKRL